MSELDKDIDKRNLIMYFLFLKILPSPKKSEFVRRVEILKKPKNRQDRKLVSNNVPCG